MDFSFAFMCLNLRMAEFCDLIPLVKSVHFRPQKYQIIGLLFISKLGHSGNKKGNWPKAKLPIWPSQESEKVKQMKWPNLKLFFVPIYKPVVFLIQD